MVESESTRRGASGRLRVRRVGRAVAVMAAGALVLAGCARDLGTLPGAVSSEASAISDGGLVVGYAGGGDLGADWVAFLRRANGEMVDLPRGPGELHLVEATAVNDAGAVAGTAAMGGGFNPMRAFRWTAADGLSLLPSSFYSRANDINERGDVVGQDIIAGTGKYDRTYLAVRWDATGTREILPTLPAGGAVCAATAISDGGDIVGTCGPEAVLWRATDRTPTGLGPGTPADINEAGLVVGSAGGVAVVWDTTAGAPSARPLRGTGSTYASGVNDGGVIVGTSRLDDLTHRAVKWASVEAEPEDLGGLGGTGAWAAAINRDGIVAGTATRPDGTRRAVRWDPEGQPAP
jgi:uncharacterized membrane protein